MLLVLAAVMAAALAGLGLGRRPPAHLPRWRQAWVGGTGAALAGIGDGWSGPAGLALLVAGEVLVAGFAWRNRDQPGFVLIGVGLVANALVLAFNGGMPVQGLDPAAHAAGHHFGMNSTNRLVWLGDDIHMAPLRRTFSPGDLVAAAGAAVAVWSRLEPARSARKSIRL